MKINRLAELRLNNDLKQQYVALYLHITQQQYSKYELGIRNIPVELLDKLADFYEVSVDWLLGTKGNNK